MKLSVVALVATYHRPKELARLLKSLSAIESGLLLTIVVDNGDSPEVQEIVEVARCSTHYVNPGRNLGCGGGLRLAGERARELTSAVCTHYLILDDDAVLAPDTLAALAAGAESQGADAAYPLVVNEEGHVGWIPGVQGADRAMYHAEGLTAEQFQQRFGNQPREFTWAQGICLLVSRRTVEATGWHRDDFWVRGEDLDFSLRLTARARGVFVPAAVVKHLPPPPSPVSREEEYLKHQAMLQNVAYLCARSPHGRRLLRTVPGNWWRFLRTWGFTPPVMLDAVRSFWRGAWKAKTAGADRTPQ
jgi:GT2 family glycosyltransferase